MKKMLLAVCAAAFAVPALAVGPPTMFVDSSPGYHYAAPAPSFDAAPALAAADGAHVPPLFFVDKRPPTANIALGGAMNGDLVDGAQNSACKAIAPDIGAASNNIGIGWGKTQTGKPFGAAS